MTLPFLQISEATIAPTPHRGSSLLKKVELVDAELESVFSGRMKIEPRLSRRVVSFQANKNHPRFRWYKYKEAFSADFVDYLSARYGIAQGTVLDPFAGMGTALFICAEKGINADGIEILPVGRHIIRAHDILLREFSEGDFVILEKWRSADAWKKYSAREINTLRITGSAYPSNTERDIGRFLAAIENEKDKIKAVLLFALLCVLESVSYTRKDGQFLRWDNRSGRRLKRIFYKGALPSLPQALNQKLGEIIADARNSMFERRDSPRGIITIRGKSCLDELPRLPQNHYDAVITSPPYCNRYDYTRTYALELALLGVDERRLCDLRQAMLSCTVENKTKDLSALNGAWRKAVIAADNQILLQSVLKYLNDLKDKGKLNNSGIARMVKGYFYEMACVIWECARALKPGGMLLMANDNVRYGGAKISIDLILCDLAENLGFSVEEILVLPQGKGNSSQQMSEFGRVALRKCIYAWRKK